MAFLASLTGGGGLSGKTDQTASGGNADVRAATGNRTFNIGGNPNIQTGLQSPWIIGAVVLLVAVYLWKRK